MQTQNRFLAFLVVLSSFIAFGIPAAIILNLTGCESIGLTQPQSVEQRLVYAYSTHTATLEAAATGVATGRLSAADGEQVLRLADESRLLLDGARIAAGAGDTSTAEGRLTLALGVLTQLQTYLNARGVK